MSIKSKINKNNFFEQLANILAASTMIGVTEKGKYDIYFNILISTFIAFVGGIAIFITTQSKYVVEKNEIQNIIKTAIINNAELDVIKNVYNNRKKEAKKFNVSLDLDYYYEENTPLSKILIDIKTNFFTLEKSNLKDKANIIKKLDNFILEYNEKNPFDTLEIGQKEHFENIRIKLKERESYDLIHIEVEKIALEISTQNKTIKEYLNDASYGFYISVFAILYTVIFSLYQIISERRQKNYLKDLLENNSADDDKPVKGEDKETVNE